MKSHLRVAAPLVGLVMALLLGEGISRLLFWRSLDFDMEMWKYATRLKREDATVGHTHIPGARSTLMGVDVQLNSLGLRGPEVTRPKPQGVRRILVGGDSFTLGWGVPEDDTFVATLSRLLNEGSSGSTYEVLNLGVGNYNTTQEVERLRVLWPVLDPDFVILAYYLNDAEPLTTSRCGWLLCHSYLAAFIASRWRHVSVSGASKTVGPYYRALYDPKSSGWLAAQAAFTDLAAFAAQHEVPVVVFVLPDLRQLWPESPFRDLHQLVDSAATRAGLRTVDLLPVFEGFQPESALWVTPLDAHPNARAHTMVAEAMRTTLAKVLDLTPTTR